MESKSFEAKKEQKNKDYIKKLLNQHLMIQIRQFESI